VIVVRRKNVFVVVGRRKDVFVTGNPVFVLVAFESHGRRVRVPPSGNFHVSRILETSK
jgi:hypothetical protein